MGVYKYDAINDELIQIAGAPSAQGLEDKVSTYTADATYWDTSPTAASTKPVISDGIKTQFDLVHNELSDVNNILGSKNILPNSATTQVINGITYTVAADGSINVTGTATADSILHIIPGTIGKLSAIFSKGGNYIISAGTTGSGVDFFFGLEYTGSTWDIGEWLKYTTYLSKEIYIDGTELNNSSSYIECYIKVNSGTTVSNIKVYPMLRPAKVKDATYVPYSKTNYELTTEISNFAKANGTSGSENVVSGTWIQVARINGLTPGVYIINGFMTFPAVNAGGSRSCRFANPNYSSIHVQQNPPANTYLTENLTDIRVVTSTEDIVFQAFQDSGMILNCSAWFQIVKLK